MDVLSALFTADFSLWRGCNFVMLGFVFLAGDITLVISVLVSLLHHGFFCQCPKN